MTNAPTPTAKSFAFRNLDGACRRSVSRRSPAAVRQRLAELEAVDGLDEIRLMGQWLDLYGQKAALVSAILAA